MDPLAEARFEVTEEDLIALHTRVMRKSPLFEKTRRRNWRVGIFSGVVVVAAFAGVAYLSAPSPGLGLKRAGYWVLAYGLIWPLFANRNLTRAAFDRKVVKIATRFVRDGKVPYTLGPCRVQLFPEHLTIIERDDTLTKSWPSARAIADEADATYLDFADGTMLRIPRRAFPTDQARGRFVDCARAFIPA